MHIRNFPALPLGNCAGRLSQASSCGCIPPILQRRRMHGRLLPRRYERRHTAPRRDHSAPTLQCATIYRPAVPCEQRQDVWNISHVFVPSGGILRQLQAERHHPGGLWATVSSTSCHFGVGVSQVPEHFPGGFRDESGVQTDFTYYDITLVCLKFPNTSSVRN